MNDNLELKSSHELNLKSENKVFNNEKTIKVSNEAFVSDLNNVQINSEDLEGSRSNEELEEKGADGIEGDTEDDRNEEESESNERESDKNEKEDFESKLRDKEEQEKKTENNEISSNTQNVNEPTTSNTTEIKIPRGRGRPPRNSNRTDIGPSGLVSITSIWADDDKPKGKRGRPRIKPIEVEEKPEVEVVQNKPLKVKRPKGPNDILLDIIHRLYKRDKQQIFAEPVNAEFVPDYYQVIKNPMDFSTMRKKVIQEEYKDFDSFANDIKLIITNCYTYNKIGTLVYRMGLILEETWDKSLEGSRTRYEQSIKNIEEYEEKKNAGEIISDSETESQPTWNQTPTSPPTLESPNPSNQRSMITRRMEARLSNPQSPWASKAGDKDSNASGEGFGRRIANNLLNNYNREFLRNSSSISSQTQQSKGPTLADICRGGVLSIKENLEKLKVERFEPFNSLLRQLATQPCIKTPTVDDWYVFDKQLSNIQYRNSVKRFIGDESIHTLKKIMDIETALLEIDPHPNIMKFPLSDIRLLGIDTDDFALFNQNLSVDGSFLLGVGENHVKLALTLQDEYPNIDLSALKELIKKYTQHPLSSHSGLKYPKHNQQSFPNSTNINQMNTNMNTNIGTNINTNINTNLTTNINSNISTNVNANINTNSNLNANINTNISSNRSLNCNIQNYTSHSQISTEIQTISNNEVSDINQRKNLINTDIKNIEHRNMYNRFVHSQDNYIDSQESSINKTNTLINNQIPINNRTINKHNYTINNYYDNCPPQKFQKFDPQVMNIQSVKTQQNVPNAIQPNTNVNYNHNMNTNSIVNNNVQYMNCNELRKYTEKINYNPNSVNNAIHQHSVQMNNHNLNNQYHLNNNNNNHHHHSRMANIPTHIDNLTNVGQQKIINNFQTVQKNYINNDFINRVNESNINRYIYQQNSKKQEIPVDMRNEHQPIEQSIYIDNMNVSNLNIRQCQQVPIQQLPVQSHYQYKSQNQLPVHKQHNPCYTHYSPNNVSSINQIQQNIHNMQYSQDELHHIVQKNKLNS